MIHQLDEDTNVLMQDPNHLIRCLEDVASRYSFCLLGNYTFMINLTKERKIDFSYKINDKANTQYIEILIWKPKKENQHSLSVFLSCSLIHS